MVVLDRRKQPTSDTETKVGQSPLESKTVHPVFCMSSQASPLKLTCTIAIQETEDTPPPSLAIVLSYSVNQSRQITIQTLLNAIKTYFHNPLY